MKIKLIINYNEEFGGTKYCLDYDCEASSTFNDLYVYIKDKLKIEDDEKCRYVEIRKDNETLKPIDGFCILDFIRLNNIDVNHMVIDYSFVGKGGGEYLNDKLKIEIRAAENNHGESAHIHISNCKGNSQVVFSLITLDILQGKDNWEKTFNRKEKKKIIIMLKENQNKFLEFYNTQLKGVVPDSISFKYDKKIYYLSYDNKTY